MDSLENYESGKKEQRFFCRTGSNKKVFGEGGKWEVHQKTPRIMLFAFSSDRIKRTKGYTYSIKTSQELRMLSKSLSDCKSLLLNLYLNLNRCLCLCRDCSDCSDCILLCSALKSLKSKVTQLLTD